MEEEMYTLKVYTMQWGWGLLYDDSSSLLSPPIGPASTKIPRKNGSTVKRWKTKEKTQEMRKGSLCRLLPCSVRWNKEENGCRRLLNSHFWQGCEGFVGKKQRKPCWSKGASKGWKGARAKGGGSSLARQNFFNKSWNEGDASTTLVFKTKSSQNAPT